MCGGKKIGDLGEIGVFWVVKSMFNNINAQKMRHFDLFFKKTYYICDQEKTKKN